ncbi:MAG TPA: GWxTD domain-containing protein [Thermoanaerobaculia bacterium]|nr:GWxTD domain-containing protein [Thermoanaerobaculia bacterium]
MLIPLLVLWLTTAAQADKALELFGQGQAALEQKKFEEASKLIQSALPAAEAITDPAQKQAALAAIHFYSALAYVQQPNAQMKAKEQIELFLVQMPKSTSVDKGQYPPEFVSTFGEVVKSIRARETREFDKRYPGYRLYSTEEPKAVSADLWMESPEFQYLALSDERSRWKSLTSKEERETFIEEFWSRRDPTPETPANEFRTVFNARVAFADRTFGNALADRGALTDRGRLLVLLGPPTQMLAEKASAYSEPETWGYLPEQLPVRIRDKSMLFRLVNDINQEYLLPPSGEYDRILSSVAEKAVRKK